MFAMPETKRIRPEPVPGPPAAPPGAAAPGKTPAQPAPDPERAARKRKFERERAIIDYLNRGVSVAEIAQRFDVGEKRMRALVREIIARRQPHPPEEFIAIQVSRLNEALLVAFSAMSPDNLKGVAEVRRLVLALDRYHGFSGARWRAAPRLADPAPPVEARPTFGAALVCHAELAPQGLDALERAGAEPVAPPSRRFARFARKPRRKPLKTLILCPGKFTTKVTKTHEAFVTLRVLRGQDRRRPTALRGSPPSAAESASG